MKKAEKSLHRAEFTSQFYRGNKLLIAATVFMYVIDAGVSASCAWLLQVVTDIASGDTRYSLLTAGIVALCIILIGLVNGLLEMLAKNAYVRRGVKQYKEYAFEKLVRKNISAFQGESTGRYISALTNDITSIETGYLSGTVSLVFQVMMLVFSVALMFYYNWLLAIVSIAVSILPIAVSMAFGNKLAVREKRVSDKNEGFVGMIKDLLTGFPVIKNFCAEKEVAGLFKAENGSLEGEKCKKRQTADLINAIMGVAGIFLQFSVFIFGAYLAMKGNITPGVVIAFIQLTGLLISPIGQIPSLLSARKAAGGLIDKMADAVYDNTAKTGTVALDGIGDGIKIEKLTFGYESEKPVLHGLDITFDAGKSYAIVGGSGSGKTTLLNVMLGYYDDYEGSVSYGGIQLRDISPDSLYSVTSIIQQNVFVFDSSIKNNITMFKAFPDERVQSAIERAGLSKLLSDKGDGYQCGENGKALSGGEKQRISIARALLQNAPVMLMDEATAALDAQTAYSVTSAILDISGLTRIIVTHRLEETLLKRYDAIIVMRNGKVEQTGTFDELMGKEGYFKSLYTVSQ